MIVELSARTFVVPLECPCCGASPDSEAAIHLTRSERHVADDSARSLAFPYCRRCIAHVSAWEASALVPVAVAVIGLIVGVILAITVRAVVGFAVEIATVGIAWWLFLRRRATVRASMGASCAAPGRALAYLGWSGTESAFSFESHTYAARFAEQNASLLPRKSPQLDRLLEGLRVARLTVPTPAAAIHTVPPPATVADWIARIEGARISALRRSLLQRALDALQDPRDRQATIAAAAGCELASVFAEIEGLSRTVAKGRLLRAMENVRADNLPEELQSAMLHQLDARARKL